MEQLELELQKEQHKNTYRKAIRSTIYTLLVVAAVAVIIAVMIFPVLRIEGTSMTETLWEKDIVVAVSGSGYKTGDIIAFYYNNKILVKRVIAVSGDWVDLDAAGNVSVNGVWLEEPYLTEKALGTCDITLPYQVPEGRIFVMGDHRATSLDSRTTEIGCIGEELIVGRILLRIWPFSSFGTVK
ncbi:MAG: signal peptidase I [Lachnospiraceae bacterium]|nr:signal peptidase I [Lachnospiraceae bacterium]